MKGKRKEMGFAMGLHGHTFGVRVQAPFGARVQKVQKVQRVVVAADTASFIKKGRGWRRRLCRRVVFASAQGATALTG